MALAMRGGAGIGVVVESDRIVRMVRLFGNTLDNTTPPKLTAAVFGPLRHLRDPRTAQPRSRRRPAPARRTGARRASPGMSSRSLSLRAGSITVVMPARSAASTFSLMPPTGSTSPRRLISPVIAMSLRTGRAGQQRGQRDEHRDPRARAVLRDRAGRHVDVDVDFSEHLRPTRAPARALTSDSAACALSFITSPSCPVRIRPSVARHPGRLDEQDVAADRRPGEAGRHAGDAAAHRDFGFELLRRRGSHAGPRRRSSPCCTLPSAIRIAALRNTLPISRSRLRTPASRV